MHKSASSQYNKSNFVVLSLRIGPGGELQTKMQPLNVSVYLLVSKYYSFNLLKKVQQPSSTFALQRNPKTEGFV